MPTHLCMLRFIVACHFLEAGVSHATSPLINKTLPFNASDANSQPTTNTTGSTVSSHMYTNTTNSVGLPQRQVGRKELAQMRSIAQWLLHLGPSVRQSSMQINTSRSATPGEGIARKPLGQWRRGRRRRRPHRRPQPHYSGRQQDAPAITTSATPNATPTAGSTNNVKNAPSAATTATVAPSTWTTTTSTPEYAGQKIRIRPISTLSSGGQLPGGQSYVNVSTPVETTPSARDSTSIIAGTTITTATPTAAAVTTTTATTSTRSATIAAATTTATTSITVTVIGYSTTITNTNATTAAQTTSATATSTNATPTTTIVTTTTPTTAIATIAATSTTTTTTTTTSTAAPAPAPAPANANPTVTPNATSNTTIVAAKPTIVIAIKKRIEAPSSSPVPPASPTIAPVGDPRKINVSVTTLFAIRINDFHVGTMLEATREQAMARVMESALGKIGHSNFTSNHIGLVSTSRMLREQATLNEPSVPDSQAASVNASQRSKVIVGIARWYPCGFGRRRCTSPDMCVHSDNGTICALREDNPPPNTSNFIAYWASALSVDCRCVSMIDGDLHATKFPLGAKLGPPPKRGRLSSIEKRFPRCKHTCGTRLADEDGLHCWCGVEFLICHPLQSCLEHAKHPHLSRCGSPAEILPWARTKNWKACPADEDKVYEGKELCACRTKRVYCIRGQRCLHNSKQGPPACQSPYNQCPANNEPSTEDVCYCKWRACAYGEMCIIDDQKPACVPHNQKLCPRWYHQTELNTMACKDNTLCDFADKCWWWGCGFMRVNWCPRDWPFMCFNAMCVAHPDLCTRYGGLRKCPCNDETTEIPVGASSDSPVATTTAPSGNDLRLLGSTSAILGGDQRRAQLRRMKGINDFDIAENKGDNSLLLDAILASIFGTDQWTAWRRRMQQNNEGDNKCACASAPLENNDIRSCVCAMATGKRPKSWSGDVDTSVTAGTATECNSCSDKQKNGDESDVDCGGSFCTPCELCFFHTKCERHLLGNLECDAHCNTAACGFDGGDCNEINQGQCYEKGCEEKQKNDGVCNEECDIVECDNDGGDCLRRGCTNSNASNYDRDASLEDDSCHYDGARPGGGAASKSSLCSQLITRRVCVFYVNCHWDRVKNECSESPGENHTISLQWFRDALYSDLRAQKWATSPTGYVQTYHVTTHFDVLVTEEEANSCLGLTAYNGKRTFNAALWEALTSEVAEALSDTHDGIAEVMAAYSTCFDRRLLDQEPSPLFHGMLGALLGVVTAAAVNTLHFCFGSHHTLKYRMDIDRQPWDSTQSGQWRVSVVCEV